MFGETLHCGELIKRLNDALGRKANNTLMCDDVTLSQIKVLATISEAADETITLKELEKQKTALEGELSIAKCAHLDFTEHDIRFLLSQFADGDKNDIEYQKRLIDMFIYSIYLYDDKMVIIYNYTGDNGLERKKSEHALLSEIDTCSDFALLGDS